MDKKYFSSGAHSFANYFIILGYSKEKCKRCEEKEKAIFK